MQTVNSFMKLYISEALTPFSDSAADNPDILLSTMLVYSIQGNSSVSYHSLKQQTQGSKQNKKLNVQEAKKTFRDIYA